MKKLLNLAKVSLVSATLGILDFGISKTTDKKYTDLRKESKVAIQNYKKKLKL